MDLLEDFKISAYVNPSLLVEELCSQFSREDLVKFILEIENRVCELEFTQELRDELQKVIDREEAGDKKPQWKFRESKVGVCVVNNKCIDPDAEPGVTVFCEDPELKKKVEDNWPQIMFGPPDINLNKDDDDA
jgi:hypothetical protein